MSVEGQILTVVFLLAFVLGVRSTFRLWRRVRVPGRSGPQSLILVAFAVVATIVTVVAGYFGVLGMRRLAGFAPVDFPLGTIAAATGIVLIPEFLDWVETRIEGSDA